MHSCFFRPLDRVRTEAGVGAAVLAAGCAVVVLAADDAPLACAVAARRLRFEDPNAAFHRFLLVEPRHRLAFLRASGHRHSLLEGLERYLGLVFPDAPPDERLRLHDATFPRLLALHRAIDGADHVPDAFLALARAPDAVSFLRGQRDRAVVLHCCRLAEVFTLGSPTRDRIDAEVTAFLRLNPLGRAAFLAASPLRLFARLQLSLLAIPPVPDDPLPTPNYLPGLSEDAFRRVLAVDRADKRDAEAAAAAGARVCAACGAAHSPRAARKCARCRRAWYCDAACQGRHWPVHRCSCLLRG